MDKLTQDQQEAMAGHLQNSGLAFEQQYAVVKESIRALKLANEMAALDERRTRTERIVEGERRTIVCMEALAASFLENATSFKETAAYILETLKIEV